MENRPADFLLRRGPISRTIIGAGLGGIAGGAHLADEGMQVDAINSAGKKKTTRLSSKMKTIRFSSKLPVAADRYRKKIAQEEDARNERNMFRSSIVGGAFGHMFRNKIPLSHSGAILAGMGAGAITQAGVRAITRNQRDQYGDKPLEVKKAETLPWKVGALAAAGVVAHRGYRKLNSFSRRGRIIEFAPQDDIAAYLGRSVVEKANRDAEKGLIDKEAKRALRDATKYRRNYDRASSLIKDAKLKFKGEKKLDERGRERKNEWDKSWVRNAGIGVGVGAAALLARRGGKGVLAEAAKQRVNGQSDGVAGLYNAVRGIVKRDIPKNPKGSIIGTMLYKGIRETRAVSRPIIRTRRAILQAGKESDSIIRKASNSARDTIQSAAGISKTGVSDASMKVYRNTKGTLDEAAQAKEALKQEQLLKLRKLNFPNKTDDELKYMSSKGRVIRFQQEVIEEIPVVDHYRRQRRKKEPHERLDAVKDRMQKEKLLTGAAGLLTGGTSIYGWSKLSPRAREQARMAKMNHQQATEAGVQWAKENYGATEEHSASFKRIAALEAQDRRFQPLAQDAKAFIQGAAKKIVKR